MNLVNTGRTSHPANAPKLPCPDDQAFLDDLTNPEGGGPDFLRSDLLLRLLGLDSNSDDPADPKKIIKDATDKIQTALDVIDKFWPPGTNLERDDMRHVFVDMMGALRAANSDNDAEAWKELGELIKDISLQLLDHAFPEIKMIRWVLRLDAIRRLMEETGAMDYMDKHALDDLAEVFQKLKDLPREWSNDLYRWFYYYSMNPLRKF